MALSIRAHVFPSIGVLEGKVAGGIREDIRSAKPIQLQFLGKTINLNPGLNGSTCYIEFNAEIEDLSLYFSTLGEVLRSQFPKAEANLIEVGIHGKFFSEKPYTPGRYSKEVQELCHCQHWSHPVQIMAHIDYDPEDPRFYRFRMTVPCPHQAYEAYGMMRRQELPLSDERWTPQAK
jgi:hypothetical protein